MKRFVSARNLIIDTGVMALYFAGDGRVFSFFDAIERKRKNGFVTAVTLSEFFYKTCEKLGEHTATELTEPNLQAGTSNHRATFGAQVGILGISSAASVASRVN
jgi:predicted nucleic acid-binding protein